MGGGGPAKLKLAPLVVGGGKRKERGRGKKKASLLPSPKNVGKCTKAKGRGGRLGLDKRKCYYCKVPWQKKEEGEGDDDARFPFFCTTGKNIYGRGNRPCYTTTCHTAWEHRCCAIKGAKKCCALQKMGWGKAGHSAGFFFLLFLFCLFRRKWDSDNGACIG